MKKNPSPKFTQRLLVIVGRTLQVVIVLTFLLVCFYWGLYLYYPDIDENKPGPQQDPPNLAAIQKTKI